MTWQELLESPIPIPQTLPWLGGREVCSGDRSWRIQAKLPQEHGWYEFATFGRQAVLGLPKENPMFLPMSWKQGMGYLAGNRFIPQMARIDPDPTRLVGQTREIYLIEPGLPRFQSVGVAYTFDRKIIYLGPTFDFGAEEEARAAFEDRWETLDRIKGVTPALDLAFLWLSRERFLSEERYRLAKERRAAEERLQRLRKQVGTAHGRRDLSKEDFGEAAKSALAVSNAELLDFRVGRIMGEMVVTYRLDHRRLECVVEKDTLRIIDSGVCLGHGREKGDRLFTLESLPGVVREGFASGDMAVYRHVPGDRDYDEDD